MERLSKSILDRLGHLFLRKVAVTRSVSFFFLFFSFFFFHNRTVHNNRVCGSANHEKRLTLKSIEAAEFRKEREREKKKRTSLSVFSSLFRSPFLNNFFCLTGTCNWIYLDGRYTSITEASPVNGKFRYTVVFSPLVRRNSPFPFLCEKSNVSYSFASFHQQAPFKLQRFKSAECQENGCLEDEWRRGEGASKKDVETNLHSPRKSAEKESRQRRYECVPQGRKTCVACSYIILYGWLCRVPFAHSARTSSAQYLAGRLDLHRHKNVSPPSTPLAVSRHVDITSFAFTFQSCVREFSRPLYA